MKKGVGIPFYCSKPLIAIKSQKYYKNAKKCYKNAKKSQKLGWVYDFCGKIHLLHDTKWGGGGGSSQIFQNPTY